MPSLDSLLTRVQVVQERVHLSSYLPYRVEVCISVLYLSRANNKLSKMVLQSHRSHSVDTRLPNGEICVGEGAATIIKFDRSGIFY